MNGGFLCPLVSSFLTEIGVFVPGCQAASLRGWSPSQGDCYDHVVFVPTSGCGEEIGSAQEKKKEKKEKTHTHTDRNTNTSAHITKQEYTHILTNALVTLM